MFEYLKGRLTKITAKYIVVEVAGIGYVLHVANPYRWYEEEMGPEARDFLDLYSNRKPGESVNQAMLRLLFSSVAFMAIVTMQDLLDLGDEARMNLPNTVGGNWIWRMTKDQLTPQVEETLLDLTTTYRRTNKKLVEKKH